jgi:hypothetical protein
MYATPEELEGSPAPHPSPAAELPTTSVTHHAPLSRRDAFARLFRPEHGQPPQTDTDTLPPLPDGEHPVVVDLKQQYNQSLLVGRGLPGADNAANLAIYLEHVRERAEAKTVPRRSFLGYLGKAGLVGAGGVLAAKGLIKLDEFIGNFVWPPTEPVSHEIPPNPELSASELTHGTFVFGGFGVKNARYIADALKDSLGTTGRVFGMEYDNRGLQFEDLAKAVSKEITEKGLTELSFYGHSMGGDVALLVAEEVLKLHPEVQLRNVFFDCTPPSDDCVRSKDREDSEFVQWAREKINSHGGPMARMAIELPNSPNTDFVSFSAHAPYVDASNLVDRIGVLKDEKLNSYAASNRLLLQMLDIIATMDVRASFERLNALTSKQALPPNYTLFRPANGEQDGTINVDAAEVLFREAAASTGARFETVLLRGTEVRHADPRGLKELYNAWLLAVLATQAESRRMLLETMQEEKASEYYSFVMRVVAAAEQHAAQDSLGQAAAPPR